MREVKQRFVEGLTTGLRPFVEGARNVQALVECYNARPYPNGLRPFSGVTIANDSLSVVWPCPAIFSASERNIVAGDRYIYEATGTTWTLTQKIDRGSSLPCFWDLIDMVDLNILIFSNSNGGMIARRYSGGSWGWAAYSPSGAPTTCKTGCNFKGQVILGNIAGGSWHDCGANSVVWSEVNQFSFTPSRTNVAGYAPNMPWNGVVMKVRKLGDSVMVYGDNGIAMLRPVENMFGVVKVANYGIAGYGAVGGNDQVHVAVCSDGYLRRFTQDGITTLGYKEFMSLMTAANIAVSYEPVDNEFYISDGVYGYLLTTSGLCQIYQLVTSIAQYSGVGYGIYDEDTDNKEWRVVTDVIDAGFRSMKGVTNIELGYQGDEEAYVAVDYRYDKTDSFTRSGWFLTNPEGWAAPQFTAPEVRLCAKSAGYDSAYLDYINYGVVYPDKRNIRGAFGATKT